MNKIELPKEITFEYLESIKYHELKAKLEELGVGDVWTAKTKKVEVIKNAIEKLAVINKLKQDNPESEDEEIARKLDLIKAQEEEEAQKDLVAMQEEEDRIAKENFEKLKEIKITKEQVVKIIKNIDANLANNIPQQRNILLQKRLEYEKLLEEM